MKTQLFQIGQPINFQELILPQAMQLANFANTQGSQLGCTLEGFLQIGHEKQGICLKFETERPQHCEHAIERYEMVLVVFNATANQLPLVIPLRKDFPLCPHTNLSKRGEPRSLCLYAEPTELALLSLTPAKLIHRIQHWFTQTASGTLHGKDQPLEPLIVGADGWLVLPTSENWAEAMRHNPTEFYRISPDEVVRPYLVPWSSAKQADPKFPRFLTIFVETTPHAHGALLHNPTNLPELFDLLVPVGVNLWDLLRQRLSEIFSNLGNTASESCKIVVIVRLPKTRSNSSEVERIDTYAFLLGANAGEIGIALDVLHRQGGKLVTIALINTAPATDIEQLNKIPVNTLNCISDCDSNLAASLSGTPRTDDMIAVVGLGSLGSQVVTNLTRLGMKKWHFFDGDLMSPHNSVRHVLSRSDTGTHKATALAELCRDILADSEVQVTSADLDVLSELLPDGLQRNGTDWVFDFSASMAVSRWIAKRDHITRALSAFLTPNGEALILLVEDKERAFRLDWLEMLHYRSILNTEFLHGVLAPPRGKLRYGWSCRDVSFEMPQDVVAHWAAMTARFVRKELNNANAKVRILHTKEEGYGEVTVTDVKIAPIVSEQVGDWKITTDLWLLEKLRKLRTQKLPSETGGVLLGTFDTFHRQIYLVDALSAPLDSQASAEYFERGFAGLTDDVRHVQMLTADQIQYVGEWHSHPPSCSTNPSAQDLKLLCWQAELMGLDALPGVMLIIGEVSHSFVLSHQLY